jgi:uncharacterized damage-inducible protein DinB
MNLAALLLAEYDEENDKTRQLLELLPDDRMTWQPHPTAQPLGRLATHLADLPKRCAEVLRHDSLDLDPAVPSAGPPLAAARADALALFLANAQETRTLFAALDDAALAAPWTFMRRCRPLLTAPRLVAIRRLYFSHTIHHRGQLTVYLRQNGIRVPTLFGSSADEAV